MQASDIFYPTPVPLTGTSAPKDSDTVSVSTVVSSRSVQMMKNKVQIA